MLTREKEINIVNYTRLKEGALAKGVTLWHGTLTSALTESWKIQFSLRSLTYFLSIMILL